ncbi:MAG: glycerol-3-phosphate acyltransferase [Calditrichia bacterium]|nr:glycerol-3-phosphate acyltransferase [Calditrichia bacterium]
MITFIITVIYSYLLGSIPTAFIFAKIFYKQDITGKGSGNVGTLNFFRVTHSKIISVAILIIDTFKGFLAVWLTDFFGHSDLLIISAAAVILGHIFPIWLHGRGGRGLATLAGVILYLNAAIVGYWWLIFTLIYLMSRKYIIAGILALFTVNIITAFINPQTFLVLSVNSLIVMLKYIRRLTQELNEIFKEGEKIGSKKNRSL